MATDLLLALDGATSRVTAFRTFEELVQACRADGYVPTLLSHRSGQPAQDIALVTRALQHLGYRVYSGTNNTVLGPKKT